jgi:hypothetical protein
MRAKLRTRIERLENRIIPETDGRLPLELLRHCMDGTVSPAESKRWGLRVARFLAEANERIARETRQDLEARYIAESPRGCE